MALPDPMIPDMRAPDPIIPWPATPDPIILLEVTPDPIIPLDATALAVETLIPVAKVGFAPENFCSLAAANSDPTTQTTRIAAEIKFFTATPY